jgi:hypothetical protein
VSRLRPTISKLRREAIAQQEAERGPTEACIIVQQPDGSVRLRAEDGTERQYSAAEWAALKAKPAAKTILGIDIEKMFTLALNFVKPSPPPAPPETPQDGREGAGQGAGPAERPKRRARSPVQPVDEPRPAGKDGVHTIGDYVFREAPDPPPDPARDRLAPRARRVGAPRAG